MRFRTNLLIDLHLPATSENIQIAPMLLIPFVENSFKHGQQVDGKLRISINLQVDDEQLLFTIKNSVKGDQQLENKPGIGLKNLKKRLQLLYPDRHSFSVKKTRNNFEAHLSLTHSTVYRHDG